MLRQQTTSAKTNLQSKQRYQPTIDALEDRVVMNSYVDANGVLVVKGTNSHDQSFVQDYNSYYYRVYDNGNTQWYTKSSVRSGYVVFDGRSGDDTFINASSLKGYLLGGSGNDSLVAGSNNDTIYGGSGNDTLVGNAGHDYMLGEDGHDTLYGNAGDDTLGGGNHNDGLFGGTGYDQLYGQGGADRFLKWTTTDYVRDASSSDAVIYFANTGAQSIPFAGFSGTYHFAAGAWTESEILMVDVALGNLHNHVGNTSLLKTSRGGAMTFERVGAERTGQQFGGWNDNKGTIAVTQASFEALPQLGMSAAERVAQVVYHEVGHNWDESHENYYATGFRQLSGWVESYSRPGWNYYASTGTGDYWWYNGSASFARDYGRTNPMEDYATTFETYFTARYHGKTFGNKQVTNKLANLDLLFSQLR